MTPHVFLLLFGVLYRLWIGKEIFDRIGEHEDWSRMPLGDLERLAFHEFSSAMLLIASYAVR